MKLHLLPNNMVFAQMLKFIPTCLSLPEQTGRQGHEFESLAHQYHAGRRLRKMTRWTQPCLPVCSGRQAGCLND